MENAADPIRGKWAAVELMGYLKLFGRLSEEMHFGEMLGRIDVPTDDGEGFTTEYFGGKSVYRVRLVDEEVARAGAGYRKPTPYPQLGQAGTPPTYPPSLDNPDLYDDGDHGREENDEDDWEPTPTAEELADAQVEDGVFSSDDLEEALLSPAEAREADLELEKREEATRDRH